MYHSHIEIIEAVLSLIFAVNLLLRYENRCNRSSVDASMRTAVTVQGRSYFFPFYNYIYTHLDTGNAVHCLCIGEYDHVRLMWIAVEKQCTLPV